MRIRVTLFVCFALMTALPGFSLPDHALYRVYWNSSGQQIGFFELDCNGSSSMTGSTSDNYEENSIPCSIEIPSISCQDVGLETVGTCDSPACVSVGYAEMFDENLVPDCNMRCRDDLWLCDSNGNCGCGGPAAYRLPRPSRTNRNLFLRQAKWRVFTPGFQVPLFASRRGVIGVSIASLAASSRSVDIDVAVP
jgi:hypothetical protein